MHSSTMIFMRMIFNYLVEHVLEKHFPSFFFAKNLEFTGKLFNGIILVFHLNQLMQGFELVVALIAT
jgi:hypothetical protein